MKSTQLKNLLMNILTQPTAPFRESWVCSSIKEICDFYEIPYHEDSYGNLWINAKNSQEVKKSPLIIVAHMDHPGMVVQKFYKNKNKVYANAKWLGGGPLDIKNQKVKIFSHEDSLVIFNAKVVKHTVKGSRGPDEVQLEIDTHIPASDVMRKAVKKYGKLTDISAKILTPKGFNLFGPWGACLWYNELPQAVSMKGDTLLTKAADDLVGVAAMLDALMNALKINYDLRTTLFISRAEESGFHGTMHALRAKIIDRKKTAILSVETSSRLPGAIPGNGPVIRLGDKMTVFDPALVHWIETLAANMSKTTKFIYQKRLMDGGTCEASAFNTFGFRVAGLSTPLENYHNQFLPTGLLYGKKPNSKTKKAYPEKVNLSDVFGLSQLLQKIMIIFDQKTFHQLDEQSFGSVRKRLIEHNIKETSLYFK